MVGTPIITREAHTGATTAAMAGGSPAGGRPGRMQREGSAGRLSSGAATPRSVGSLSAGGGRLRGIARSPHAPGMQTFGQKYLPFAAGQAAGGNLSWKRIHAPLAMRVLNRPLLQLGHGCSLGQVQSAGQPGLVIYKLNVCHNTETVCPWCNLCCSRSAAAC